MDEEILDEQRELVAALSEAGWEVTEAELSLYQSPWEDDTPEATVTLTASKAFPEAEFDRDRPEDADDDNPFRYK